MSMNYIRRTYGVPAKRGARVQYDGVTLGQPPLLGTITSATNSGHLRVRFDGERRTLKLHPTWALVYLKTPNGLCAQRLPAPHQQAWMSITSTA